VEKTLQGIKLTKEIVEYTKLPGKAYDLFARDAETLIRAGEENLESSTEGVKNLHLRTEYDNIFQEELPIIRQWLYEQGCLFHRRAREYLSKFDKDITPNQKAGGGRVVLKSFSWTYPGREAPDDATTEGGEGTLGKGRWSKRSESRSE